ncbi:helix-turn-helix domain-containing protein [[Clostridium] fimetarium]|uniref:HTH cro/C1-type domain-containing protein n=1 Tax=[Clostridium] fimetarium TaxID=99656 RepID=A0A1I0RF23_9FIRM|nr:helix-turn-helix transcriptional regulator [[Clostridium] fimetarium]SEW38830.1 hypothetical protein SAMN05421659_11447 [[Clostridium] fimetarium]
MKIVNERIKELRQYKGISEEDMAIALDIEIKVYRTFEDSRELTITELCTVADILDVSTEYLLGRVDIPHPVITDENLDQIKEMLKSLR